MSIFISEDRLVRWIQRRGAATHTRKHSNINKISLSGITLVCLTGFESIVRTFFTEIIQHLEEPITLITVETDGFDMKKEYLDNDKIKHWFTWNKPFDHPKLTCIPIGLNFDRQSISLNRWLASASRPIRDKNLLVNFSAKTHASRAGLLEKGRGEWSSFCDTVVSVPDGEVKWVKSMISVPQKIEITHPSYYGLLSRYKFVLSPPGYGLDCHRTWEALYVGAIPIVLSSSIDSLYEGLPILVVKSWDEITESFLERRYNEIMDKKCDISRMYMGYWISKIENSITKK